MTNSSHTRKMDRIIRIMSRNNSFAFNQAQKSMGHVVLLLLQEFVMEMELVQGQFLGCRVSTNGTHGSGLKGQPRVGPGTGDAGSDPAQGSTVIFSSSRVESSPVSSLPHTTHGRVSLVPQASRLGRTTGNRYAFSLHAFCFPLTS